MKYQLFKIIVFCSILFTVIGALNAQTDRIYININAVGLNTGESWENAYTSIDSLFTHVKKFNEVWIAKGNYTGSPFVNWWLNGLNVSIFGGFVGDETSVLQRDLSKNVTELNGKIILDWGEAKRYNVLFLRNGIYILDGLVLENGDACGLNIGQEEPDCTYWGTEGFMCKGGGIYVYSEDISRPCNLTLINCTIRNNDAIEGGGVYVNSTNSGKCKLMVDSCLFTKNYSTDNCGGLCYVANEFNTDDIIIKNTTFLRNYSGFGVGGMSVQNFGYAGKILIENCKFTENKAYVVGAATVNHLPVTKAYINNCEFNKNVSTTGNGGGIAALNFLFGEVNNCSFTGNITWADNLHVRTVDFRNCLFAKNRSYKPESNLISTSEWGLPKPNEESNFYNCSFYDDSNGAKNMFSGIGQNTNFYNCAFSAKDTNIVFFNNVTDTLSFTNCSFSRKNYEDKFFSGLLQINNVFQTDCLWNTLPDYRDTMNNDFRLTSCSPLLNKGSNLVLPLIDSTDLAGGVRVLDGLIDIGAYESPLIKYSYNTNSDNICASDTLGSIVFNVEGGIAPYSLMYKDQNYKTLHVENIQSGTQTIILTDSSNCKLAIEENFGPEKISFDTVLIDASSKLSSDGSIVLKNIKGGNPPISLQWSNGISGDSLGSLAFGFYQVTITDQNGCSETFNFFVNAPNQTQKQAINRLFKLMPNPVKNILTIEIITQNQATSLKSIRCFDVLGKEVFKSPINSYTGQLTVNTEKLSNGLYIIELSDENGIRYVQKFVKE